jgi:hypothetical protein
MQLQLAAEKEERERVQVGVGGLGAHAGRKPVIQRELAKPLLRCTQMRPSRSALLRGLPQCNTRAALRCAAPCAAQGGQHDPADAGRRQPRARQRRQAPAGEPAGDVVPRRRSVSGVLGRARSGRGKVFSGNFLWRCLAACGLPKVSQW